MIIRTILVDSHKSKYLKLSIKTCGFKFNTTSSYESTRPLQSTTPNLVSLHNLLGPTMDRNFSSTKSGSRYRVSDPLTRHIHVILCKGTGGRVVRVSVTCHEPVVLFSEETSESDTSYSLNDDNLSKPLGGDPPHLW